MILSSFLYRINSHIFFYATDINIFVEIERFLNIVTGHGSGVMFFLSTTKFLNTRRRAELRLNFPNIKYS